MPSSDPERRLRDIIYAICRIRIYLDEIGGIEALFQKESAQRDAIERRLLTISEAAKKLSPEIEMHAPEISWAAIRGMGNFIRHAYDNLDEIIIRRVIETELERLETSCLRLLNTWTKPS